MDPRLHLSARHTETQTEQLVAGMRGAEAMERGTTRIEGPKGGHLSGVIPNSTGSLPQDSREISNRCLLKSTKWHRVV